MFRIVREWEGELKYESVPDTEVRFKGEDGRGGFAVAGGPFTGQKEDKTVKARSDGLKERKGRMVNKQEGREP